MEQEKKKETEKKKSTIEEKTDQWIDKAEALMDETSDKIYNSETYRKADKAVEKATKSIFRKVGRWWGKSTH